MDRVEASGRTVEDALNAALRKLGARIEDVELTILDEGKRGFFFGAGARDAQVRVERKQPSGRGGGGTAPPARREQQSQETESGGRRRRGGRGRGRRSDDATSSGDTNGKSNGKSNGGRQRSGGSSRSSSRRSYDQPVPELTDSDFLKRPTDEDFAEAPAEEPRAQHRQEQRPRRERSSRGRSNAEGRARERRRQAEPFIEPNIDHELVDVAATVVDDVLRILDLDASINLREPLTAGDGRGSALAVIDISGDDLGVLIGRRGETLLNLQYLVNLIVGRRYPDEGGVTIDIEHYRHRREEQLVDLANRMADRVRENGNPITLEPMSAADRRLVHLTLADDPDVETHSTGDGEDRKVVISQRQ